MYISPRHTNDQFPTPPNLEEKIELFYARIDGWQLEVADRCINGWIENGIPCITTHHSDKTVHYIPDSGWAVMQISLNYFEIVTVFKRGLTMNQRNKLGARERFEEGVRDVFVNECKMVPKIPEILWKQFRSSLYHTSFKGCQMSIGHPDDEYVFHYEPNNEILTVDPHNFVKVLRKHLSGYVVRLTDPDEVELRSKFLTAYDSSYSL